MNSSADECNWGTLCRYWPAVAMRPPTLPDNMDPQKQEIIERFVANAQNYIKWLNDSRLDGTAAKIDKQYREGHLSRDYKPFSWFGD